MIRTSGIDLAQNPHYAFSNPSQDQMLSSTKIYNDNAAHMISLNIELLSGSLRVESHAEVFICSMSVVEFETL
jgi:hypothetical protein